CVYNLSIWIQFPNSSFVMVLTTSSFPNSFTKSKLIPPKSSLTFKELKACWIGGVNGWIFTNTGSDFTSPLLNAYKTISCSSVLGNPSTDIKFLYKDDFAVLISPSIEENSA